MSTQHNTLKIGWSGFALRQNRKPLHSQFRGEPIKLLTLVEKHWAKRVPGQGRPDLSEVVVVPIEEKNLTRYFSTPWGKITGATQLRAKLTRRQPHEDPYIEVQGKGRPLPVRFARVVLYSAATLLLNDGGRSGDYDWEIVAILTGPWEKEPMTPLTMARNFLQKPGGTLASYTAKHFAESIYFWSQFCKVNPNIT